MLKKICLILCLSFLLLGCIRKTSSEDKEKITRLWILHRNKNSEVKIKNELAYLEKKKEKATDDKVKKEIEEEIKEWNYFIEIAKKKKLDEFFETFCFYFIKDELREPESYKLDYVLYKKIDENTYNIVHSYRAKNKYGGYDKNRNEYTLPFTDEDFKTKVMDIVVIRKRMELTKQIMEERKKRLNEMKAQYPMLFK